MLVLVIDGGVPRLNTHMRAGTRAGTGAAWLFGLVAPPFARFVMRGWWCRVESRFG